MNKYNSSYTEEQFEYVLDILEDNWTQLEFVGGVPGQEVKIFPGTSYFVENLIMNYSDSDWQFENATGGLTDTENMLYPNYNKFSVRSYYNNEAQSDSRCKLSVDVIAGHKYYLSAFADGIVSNENLTLNEYNSSCNKYGISLEKTNLNDSVCNEFAQDLAVHELTCIGQIPEQNTDQYIISLYSNKDTVARDATVYFGCITLVDLTEIFGEGKEPDKEWCNNYLRFYDGLNQKETIHLAEENDSYLVGTFNSDGICIIDVPGFGLYTAVISSQEELSDNIVYYNNIEVNKIKRYTIDIR